MKSRKKREAVNLNQKETLGIKMATAMNIPPNVFSNIGHIEFNGNREVVVDGYRGIHEYDDTIIKINLGKIMVRFIGRGLEIGYMSAGSVVIRGYILSMEFIG